MNFTIIPAEPWHVGKLAAVLRAEDCNEVLAHFSTAKKAIWLSYRRSFMCRSAFLGDEVAAMWGVGGGLLDEVGYAWLLTSSAVERLPLSFVRNARSELQQMLHVKQKLEGMVAADYTRAIRFLRLLGFTVGDPEPFGRGTFCRYEMVR